MSFALPSECQRFLEKLSNKWILYAEKWEIHQINDNTSSLILRISASLSCNLPLLGWLLNFIYFRFLLELFVTSRSEKALFVPQLLSISISIISNSSQPISKTEVVNKISLAIKIYFFSGNNFVPFLIFSFKINYFFLLRNQISNNLKKKNVCVIGKNFITFLHKILIALVISKANEISKANNICWTNMSIFGACVFHFKLYTLC